MAVATRTLHPELYCGETMLRGFVMNAVNG